MSVSLSVFYLCLPACVRVYLRVSFIDSSFGTAGIVILYFPDYAHVLSFTGIQICKLHVPFISATVHSTA